MNFCWVNVCDVDLACSSLSAQCCGCPSLCSLHGALQSWNWQRTGKFLPLHCSRTTLCPSSHTARVPTSRVWRSVGVLVWHQLKPSPPFPAGGMFRRPWGVPFQFLFSFARGRQHWAVCSLLWYYRENCISSWGSRYILAIPSYPNKDDSCGRDFRPWTGEQRSVWAIPSALGRDSKPWPLHQVVTSAGAGPHQAVTPLSWTACKQYPCQRWFAKPSDSLCRKKSGERFWLPDL